MNDIGLFGVNVIFFRFIGKRIFFRIMVIILNKFGKRIFFRFIRKRIFFRIWILILNRFGKRIFFRILDSYFEKIWEKNIL